MSDLHDQFFAVPKTSTLESLEEYGNHFADWQRGVPWWLGDLARYAEARWPDTWQQVFPEWVSPGLIARCKAVAQAYPNEADRNPLASWTIHMQESKYPDRVARVQSHVDAGRTSDEARKASTDDNRARWLLAVDTHYYTHKFWFSGAGVEAAMGVSEWIQRTVDRLKAEKGLSDVVCCFDSRTNFRKELTKDWEDAYKPRPPKDPELVQQLTLVRQLLEGHGFCCASLDGFEADDVMASYATQFDGKVTLLCADKDVRQCLSNKCNMLTDVEWTEDETSGDMLPNYKWLTAKTNTEATGIRPDQWADYQAIMGDNTDGIKGAPGIGEKGAATLIQTFGTLDNVIQAARDNDERLKPRQRESLLELAERLDIVRQLVTLRTDLTLPTTTRI
jgi:5'-3' exonuclease